MRALAISALTLTFSLGLFAGSASAADQVVGYVDLERAISETEEGKRAMARIKKEFDQKQSSLTKQETALMAEKQKLDKELAVANSQTKRTKQAAFEGKILKLQQDAMKQQQELQELRNKEIAGLARKMRVVIAEIGKTNNYTLILEIKENRLLYGKPHLDITNEVIRKYNKAHK